jgi:hypothetical protein
LPWDIPFGCLVDDGLVKSRPALDKLTIGHIALKVKDFI